MSFKHEAITRTLWVTGEAIGWQCKWLQNPCGNDCKAAYLLHSLEWRQIFYWHISRNLISQHQEHFVKDDHQGPVIPTPFSVNPGLNFSMRFSFFCSKVFSRKIFCIVFRASNGQIVKKNNLTEFVF